MVARKKSARRKKSQRLYKMKGCNKKGCNKTRKHLGGSSDANLAYTLDKVHTVPNPHLAANPNLARAYPSHGPPSGGFNFLNPQNTQRGGCGCGSPLLSGGSLQKGGAGNNGIPYPNGLVGTAWTAKPTTWPGVDGVSGNSNHYPQNDYKVDPQTAMKNVGAQPPFLGGGRKKNKRSKRNQRGGDLSNFLTQDLINLGRQFQYGVGTAYNGITGYSAPVNPLPWKGQMPNTPNFASVKAMLG